MELKTDKVYLVGFMGAGKSTVAVALGERLGWEAADIDQIIETRERRSIAEVFETDGEEYFRQLERRVLQELLPQRRLIVATGGGTFIDPANQTAINRDGASIWLDVSFATVSERLPSDGSRPLATDRTSMLALWNARRAGYEYAQFRLQADTSPVDDLVEQILDKLS